ncbi:MAG: IS30 family transposase [Bacteroidales bacterium]|nr:IS30 family transposase [Bacteroidales bacterium]
MTYTHITINELVLIEAYYKINTPVKEIATSLSRARETIYKVIRAFKSGVTALEYYNNYCENKKRCGRKKSTYTEKEKAHILLRVSQGWSPDIIYGREIGKLPYSSRTLYRRFKDGTFSKNLLPMKGKRKPNGHKEKRGKQSFLRNIRERVIDYPEFDSEFGHIEGDTIIGKDHKSAVITLVERLSKVIITLKPKGRKASDIKDSLEAWLENVPNHLFKSITFDCGKEFSDWKTISNNHDISIYFADPGTPSQRGLNENSNGLLRKDGLHKKMDFNEVSEMFIQSVAHRRNNIPRKSLNYLTPIEKLLTVVDEEYLSSLY